LPLSRASFFWSMMSMVSVVSQGRRTALLTGIFSAAVVSMVSRNNVNLNNNFKVGPRDSGWALTWLTVL